MGEKRNCGKMEEMDVNYELLDFGSEGLWRNCMVHGVTIFIVWAELYERLRPHTPGFSFGVYIVCVCIYIYICVCVCVCVCVHTYTHVYIILTHCGRVTQICVFNTVKLGTSASSP